MKMKKLGAFAASVAMVGALALTGCGNAGASRDSAASDSGSVTADSGSAESSTEVKLADDGKLTVGVTFEPEGFDTELAQALADKLGLELQIKRLDLDVIVPTMTSRSDLDMGIVPVSVTAESEEVDLTDFSYSEDQAIVTLKSDAAVTGDNYADELSKSGVNLGVQAGSAAFVEENFPEAAHMVHDNAADGLAGVMTNAYNAAVVKRSIADQLMPEFSDEQVIKLVPEEWTVAVSKDNPGLRDKLNDAFTELTEDGTLDNLMSKYGIK